MLVDPGCVLGAAQLDILPLGLRDVNETTIAAEEPSAVLLRVGNDEMQHSSSQRLAVLRSLSVDSCDTPRIDQLDAGVRVVLQVPGRARGVARSTDRRDLRVGRADRQPSRLSRN